MVEINTESYQRTGLHAVVKTDVFGYTNTFLPLTSGQITNSYFECSNIQRNGTINSNIIQCMMRIMKHAIPDIDSLTNNNYVICGGQRKDWFFSSPVATKFDLPHAALCKDGTILGADPKDKLAVLVIDILNQGSSPRDLWVPAIENAGGKVVRTFSFLDTLEDGVKVMEDLGIEYDALVTMNDSAWEYLEEKIPIPDDAYDSIMERRKDKDAWARKMLLSDSGSKELKRLLKDSETREKAIKIIYAGYPDLTDRLLQRLEALDNLLEQ